MIPYGKHYIDEEDIQAVVDVLRSGTLTQGPAIEAFENEIAQYTGAKFAVAVSSGTAALHIAALAAGVSGGSALVTSPITFVASANAGLYAGGRVVFADVDPATTNMCPDSLNEVLLSNSDVRAIVPVHFAGLPCDMNAIKRSADKVDAVVIEDAAHALGASYPSGKRVGSCENSLMTIFSFHPVKAIAAGEGGMITTNDEKIYRKLLRLRSHGINKLDDEFLLPDLAFTGIKKNPWYYEMQEIGFNYRITDIQAALGLSQFKKIDKFIKRRHALSLVYDEAFSGNDNIFPAQGAAASISGHHLYVIRVNFGNLNSTRAEYMAQLRAKGIVTQVHYIPVPLHPYYNRFEYDLSKIENSMRYYEQALSIPLYYGLSDSEQQYVIESLGFK